MSESSHKCNIIQLHSMNYIIALTAWVCHVQIAGRTCEYMRKMFGLFRRTCDSM